MFHPVPVYVGLRYVVSRNRGFFISFISWISMLGICVGVAALITIISVMNGLERETRTRLLSLASHATIGAFAGLVANVNLGLPIVPSLAFAFMAAAIVGLVTDEFVLKPFRAAGFITTAIGSIALTIALENVVRFVFGNELRGYDLPIQRDWRFEGLRIGPQQVQNLLIAVAVMGAVFLFLFAGEMIASTDGLASPTAAILKSISRPERAAKPLTRSCSAVSSLWAVKEGGCARNERARISRSTCCRVSRHSATIAPTRGPACSRSRLLKLSRSESRLWEVESCSSRATRRRSCSCARRS